MKILDYKVPAWLALVGVVIVSGLGDGWIIDSLSLRQQSAGHDIDRIMAISELRERELEIYKVVAAIAAEVENLRQTNSLTDSHLYRLSKEYEIARKNYDSIELSLGRLEDREPEPLGYVPFPPMAPKLMSVD